MTKATMLIASFLLIAPVAFSQTSDLKELNNQEFIELVRRFKNPSQYSRDIETTGGRPRRCGFEIAMEMLDRRSALNHSQWLELQALIAPAPTDRVISSPSGLFRIYYDTSGVNGAAMLDANGQRIPGSAQQYAQRVGEFFDESYMKEVTELGYGAPPSPPYAIYLKNMGVGTYGITWPVEPPITGSETLKPRYRTFIEMDNDFQGFFSSGLSGARVTAAHEFHHMIQLGAYGSWGTPDIYFYEMTSTYFEDVVYPDINDYYIYLNDYFDDPQLPFYDPQVRGYQAAIFLKMLDKKYGGDVLLNTWQRIKQTDPMSALNSTLNDIQSNLMTEMCRFSIWNYFTSSRASKQDSSERYDEAGIYPLVAFEKKMTFVGSQLEFNGAITPVSSMYFEAYKGGDTAVFIVSNGDFESIRNIPSRYNRINFTITVLEYQPAGNAYIKLSNGWAYKLDSTHPELLCVSAIVNEALEDPGIVSPFPNPFTPETDGSIRFPLPVVVPQAKADLYIYSPSMNLVYEGPDAIIYRDQKYGAYMVWDGQPMSGGPLASGVYFYTIIFGGESKSGKFAVVRK